MATKRKFRVGTPVRQLDELTQHEYFMIRLGSKWKTVHNGFVRSWQLNFCWEMISKRNIRVAERLTNAEYYDNLEDDELMDMLETDLCEYCEENGSVIGSCEGRWCDAALDKWKEDLVK